MRTDTLLPPEEASLITDQEALPVRVPGAAMDDNDRSRMGASTAVGSTGATEEMGIDLDDLGESTFTGTHAREEQKAILESLERRRLARTLAVPTDDGRVRHRLRKLLEPVTLFGEGPSERRDRLKEILSTKMMSGGDGTSQAAIMSESDSSSDDEDDVEGDTEVSEFYTYGPEELSKARRNVLEYSIQRAKDRMAMQRAELEVPFGQRKKTRHELYSYLTGFETKSLQFGDDRPMGYCTFAPNSKMLATASWSGMIKLWSVPGSEQIGVMRGHRDRVSGMAFHPRATLDHPTSALNLVSGAVDGSVNLWSLEQDTPISRLVGHDMRVARVAFHPSGEYIGTASFDTTWRLWSAETQQELLMQEGHSREVFTIGFQNDGALVATAGMDSIGRIWDLRTGRSIMVLKGHAKPILGLDWSPNGYQMATGSEDSSIRIWDIRAAASVYTIPAHKNIVSQVKYWHATEVFENPLLSEGWSLPQLGGLSSMTSPPVPRTKGPKENQAVHTGDVAVPDTHKDIVLDEASDATNLMSKGSAMRRQFLSGSFLVSSSYDGTCKLWTEGDYKPLKALTGLEAKVMCTDISGDGKYIATALYDRTFKMYASSEE
ncbi:hypothetical protein BASA60_006131 [Batrachochytrium salamandrivorans]|nr:hypothetical protein BASA62_004456 [Batrachochytrium salamandrivorans]KAH6573245.1 hypothetical protein BASA60_006131 [Batrachochytrium salamandrivorans]KAH9269569.1 hypothetical protein BASA83_008389 [Batrachochytrium salamandrivorans]